MIYDLSAIRGILESYIAKPELVKTLYVDEEQFPSPDLTCRHRWLLEILHICSNKGYQEFTEDLLEDIIDNYTSKYNPPRDPESQKSIKELLKNDCRQLQILAHKNPEAINAQAHYDVIQKCSVLNCLKTKGYDISPFWYEETDPLKHDTARKNLDEKSTTDILDYYKNTAGRDMDEIRQQLSLTSPYSPIRADDLPGADKKTTFLIGQESSDHETRDYIEWMELGTFNSVIGAAKAGKTQLMMQMAFAVQNGLPLWGMPTLQGDVLYVDFELSEKQIKKRFNYLRKYFAWKMGVEELPPDQNKSMYYLAESKAFGEGKVDLPGIIDACNTFKRINANLRLIVFDCFYTFVEGDPNLEQDAKATLQKLKTLVDDHTTVCYVHHTNKAGFNDMGDVIYAAGGSGVHGKIVDTTYVVYPHHNPRSNEIDKFRIATTGRSSCGGTIDCQRDAGSFWLFDKYADDGNQQPRETTFNLPDPEADNRLTEEFANHRTTEMEQDPKCVENFYDPDARASTLHETT